MADTEMSNKNETLTKNQPLTTPQRCPHCHVNPSLHRGRSGAGWGPNLAGFQSSEGSQFLRKSMGWKRPIRDLQMLMWWNVVRKHRKPWYSVVKTCYTWWKNVDIAFRGKHGCLGFPRELPTEFQFPEVGQRECFGLGSPSRWGILKMTTPLKMAIEIVSLPIENGDFP